MADWKALLTNVLLADGTIDAGEARLLSRAIFADGQVDDEEVEFLVGLRNKAKKPGAAFEALFFKALTSNILADGRIDAGEATRLKKILFADGKIDAGEKAFLRGLRKKATWCAPEFEALYAKCMAS